MRILVINGGSSSFKLWFADLPEIPEDPPIPDWSAHLDNNDIAAALKTVPHTPGAIGHRIVHGGPLRDPSLLTPGIKDAIASQVEFAPSHNRFELEAIAAAEQAFPAVPQYVVFDTGFHKPLDPAASTYPGPRAWLDQGIRRYG